MDEFEGILDVQEEESRVKRVLKGFFRGIIALFLIFLFISILIFGWNIMGILEGKVESSKLEGFSVEFDDGIVVFDKEVYEELKEIYVENQKTEVKICLKGYKDGEIYYINGLEMPEMYEKSVFHVVSEGCDSETIISMHTHPFKHCIFSKKDIESYELFKEVNEDGIIGLMCEIDRFTFYK